MLGHLPSLDGNVSATKKTLPTASGDWYSSGHRLSVPSALRDRRQLQVIVFAMFYKAGARKLAAGFAELGCASATNGAARMLTLMVQPNRRRPITQSPGLVRHWFSGAFDPVALQWHTVSTISR
jgi:hypothetical protein